MSDLLARIQDVKRADSEAANLAEAEKPVHELRERVKRIWHENLKSLQSQYVCEVKTRDENSKHIIEVKIPTKFTKPLFKAERVQSAQVLYIEFNVYAVKHPPERRGALVLLLSLSQNIVHWNKTGDGQQGTKATVDGYDGAKYSADNEKALDAALDHAARWLSSILALPGVRKR